MLKLVVRQGPSKGREYPIPPEYSRAALGSDINCEIPLPDPSVSARHAQLVRKGGGLLLRDLTGREGTMLNGHPVKQDERLSAGDTIQIGAYLLELVEEVRGGEHPPDHKAGEKSLETMRRRLAKAPGSGKDSGDHQKHSGLLLRAHDNEDQEDVEGAEAVADGKEAVVAREPTWGADASSRGIGHFLRTPQRFVVAFWTAAGLIAALLLLVIVAFVIASGRAARIEVAETELETLREEIASRPPAAEVEKLRRTARQHASAGTEASDRAKELEAKLRKAQGRMSTLEEQIGSHVREKSTLEKELRQARSALSDAERTLAALRARHSQTLTSLRSDLAQAQSTASDVKGQLAELRKGLSGAISEKEKLQSQLRRTTAEHRQREGDLKRDLKESRMRTRRLEARLAKLPEVPLSSKEAKSSYLDAVDRAAALKDRDERIAAFREMAFALAGTPYGAKAAWLWRREIKLKE